MLVRLFHAPLYLITRHDKKIKNNKPILTELKLHPLYRIFINTHYVFKV